MKILITGATGFVGTWLTKKLLDRGHDIRVLSTRGTAEFPFNSASIEIAHGNVCDYESMTRACKDIHSVFHLAGIVGYSRLMRPQMEQTNVVGTKNVVEACLTSRCKRLVHISSVTAIGASFDKNIILNEDSEFNLHHLNLGYFETKYSSEQLVKSAVREGKIDAVILNPATIYGPGDAKKGSRSIQLKVARGKFPFYTSGGVNVIHIDDVVDAIYRAWEVGRSGERYILAGENILIQKLFSLIAEQAGARAPYIYLPNFAVLSLGKIGDFLESIGQKGPINSENAWTSILYHWFDNSKAKKELGLNPRSAHDAIADSIRWIKENGLI
ncbi:MAG: dihydroflavonol 4-reductase [Bdellovibrionales bacterium RBG_16_40_8]|nr:MAG: dihydroflavonol 4-reductase [Bdellovibrionales bacterium RBG_16_40_8]